MKPICVLLQNHYDGDIRVRRKAEALVNAGYSVEVFALRNSGGRKDYYLEGVHVRTLSLGRQGAPWLDTSTSTRFFGCGHSLTLLFVCPSGSMR